MKFAKEFKDFIDRGNFLDLAIAVVMGAAFTAIVNAIIVDFINPLLSYLTPGIEFSKLVWGSGPTAILYGSFIQSLINFLLIALVIFFLIKGINRMMHRKPVDTTECPYCGSTIPVSAVRCPNCTTILDPGRVPESIR
jgi:large conductance mechanosensitive channel